MITPNGPEGTSMTVESGQQGGCQCGAIRYRLLRAPAALRAQWRDAGAGGARSG